MSLLRAFRRLRLRLQLGLLRQLSARAAKYFEDEPHAS